MRTLISIALLTTLFACNNSEKINSNNRKKVKAYRYLALGDSYTIGEMVEPQEAFPNQLINRINSISSFQFDTATIIAKTGWRSDELMEATKVVEDKYDLVSLLIGVNNQYQGRELVQFAEDFEILLDKAISFSKNGAKGVFVYSIPDYSVTPFMRGKNIHKVANELKEYNSICKDLAIKKGVTFYDITPISEKAKFDSNLIADDKLHPSAKMYKLWIDETVGSIISNQLK